MAANGGRQVTGSDWMGAPCFANTVNSRAMTVGRKTNGSIPEDFGRLLSIINKLSDAQKDAIGFGYFLHLQPTRFRSLLCSIVIEKYSLNENYFRINDTCVPITAWDTFCILGVPDEGIEIGINE